MAGVRKCLILEVCLTLGGCSLHLARVEEAWGRTRVGDGFPSPGSGLPQSVLGLQAS